MRHYSERPDGTIEYIDREWFINRLINKIYMEDEQDQRATEPEGERLDSLDDEQLAQEYADKIGDPKNE